mmetsp:Transcript_88345/g.140573  ORF Transcript_88345/g.140573 Transcript_88345/m.140573 type:complete len:89 (+) Transcript_88345:794-1060(+)
MDQIKARNHPFLREAAEPRSSLADSRAAEGAARAARAAAFNVKILENGPLVTVLRWVLRIQPLTSKHLPGDWSKARLQRFVHRDSSWF